MYGSGANNQFDEFMSGKRTHITQWDLIQYTKKAAAPSADEYDARYIMPLSKFKKKVEYTNPIRKYNEMIGSTSSGISFLVLTEPEDICKDGGLVKKILKPGDDRYQHVDDYDYVLVKYEARLDDGTLVKKSDDDGVEFTLNDGQLVVQSLPTTFIIHTTLLYFPFPGRSLFYTIS